MAVGDDRVAAEEAAEADLTEGLGIIRGRDGPPTVRVFVEPEELDVVAEVQYVSFEGRADAAAARHTIRSLQPKQLVVLGADNNNGVVAADAAASGSGSNSSIVEHNSPYHSTETLLLADAVRDSTTHKSSVFAPRVGSSVTLSVGSAAFNARLVDKPYMPRDAKAAFEVAVSAAEAAGRRPPLPPRAVEAVEATMGTYTVSVVDLVATGQRVAEDGAIVFAPRAVSSLDNGRYELAKKTVLLSVGDVLLTDLRLQFVARNMKAEYSTKPGFQQLIVNSNIIVKREADTGHIKIEGPLCEDFFACRQIVYGQYVML